MNIFVFVVNCAATKFFLKFSPKSLLILIILSFALIRVRGETFFFSQIIFSRFILKKWD